MNTKDRRIKADCQLQTLYDSGRKLTFWDRARYISLRFLSALKRRLRRETFLAPHWENHPDHAKNPGGDGNRSRKIRLK